VSALDRLAVALDHEDPGANLELVRRLRGRVGWFKVGMRLFYAEPERSIAAVREAGARLFLDLKLHDIPETVRGAARALAVHAPDLVTIHGLGGAAMAVAAREGFAAGGSPGTRVIAVTILTSMDAPTLVSVGLSSSPGQAVERIAATTADAGVDGWVCSPHEVASLRGRFADAMLVVPGIRFDAAAHEDQRRVGTPSEALAAGASLLVVGRPILRAADPVAATEQILEQVRAASP
jgi:orotidine-5'-phosphate decarboxylase